jgi:integrase
VFSTRVKTAPKHSPISGFSKVKKRLDNCVNSLATDHNIKKPDHWTFHDIRRTVATGMAKLGFPSIVVDRILNHTTSSSLSTVAAIYNRHEYAEERREALIEWSKYVQELIKHNFIAQADTGCDSVN